MGAEGHRAWLGVAVLAGIGCAPPPPSPPPVIEEVDPVGLPVLVVELAPAAAVGTWSHPDETRGLATVLVELGLAELEGVVPRVATVPASPALARPVELGVATWSLALEVAVPDALTISGRLCDPADVCVAHGGTAPEDELQRAVAELLDALAGDLGRPPDPATAEGWRAPLTADPYARLLAGRAAATWYGLRPAAEGAAIGHSRRDPIDRAVLVDPWVAPAAWVLSRRDASRDEAARARVPLTRARAKRPWSVVLVAENAALLDVDGAPSRRADLAWQEVGRLAPHDLRWTLPRAAAALRAGDPGRASELLDGLPAWAQEAETSVALRVSIADASDPSGARDALLARWQDAAAKDPEPVRRRIALRIASAQYAEALALTSELSRRGARADADALALPLALGAGAHAEARRAAEAQGFVDVQAALDARARLVADPADVEAVPASQPVLRAAVLLAAGRADHALAAADDALGADPWNADALAMRARALDALGRDPTEAWRRARWADPAVQP